MIICSFISRASKDFRVLLKRHEKSKMRKYFFITSGKLDPMFLFYCTLLDVIPQRFFSRAYASETTSPLVKFTGSPKTNGSGFASLHVQLLETLIYERTRKMNEFGRFGSSTQASLWFMAAKTILLKNECMTTVWKRKPTRTIVNVESITIR